MRKKAALVLSLIVLITLNASSCWRQKPNIGGCLGPSHREAQPGPGNQVAPKASGNFKEKRAEMNALTTCINKLESGLGVSPHEAYQRFYQYINREDFSCKRVPRYVQIPLATNISECQNALKKAPQNNYPQLQSQLRNEYIPALKKMTNVLKEAKNYFEQEDYKDDGCAQGQVFAQSVGQSYDKFTSSKNSFEKPYRKAKRSLDLENLAYLESKEGRGIAWQFLNIQIAAEDLIDIMINFEQPQAKVRYIEQFKIFENKYSRFEEFVKQNEGKIQKVPILFAAKNEANRFYTDAKLITRRLEENSDNYSNQLRSSVDAYNRFVNDFNIYNNMKSFYDKMMK